MRGKTSGGCNTGAGIYAMELLPCAEKPFGGDKLRLQNKCGELCKCCHARENLRRLQYKRGKLCNCCHACQSLWWLKYKCRKLCNWCHARQKLWRLQTREYPADAKRGNTRKLPMQTYGLFQEWEARSCLDMFAQNCWTLEGVSWTFETILLTTSSTVIFESVNVSTLCRLAVSMNSNGTELQQVVHTRQGLVS